MNYRTRDRLAVDFGVMLLLLIIGGIVLSVWLSFFAPCKYVGWMPAKDVPNRCADFDKETTP